MFMSATLDPEYPRPGRGGGMANETAFPLNFSAIRNDQIIIVVDQCVLELDKLVMRMVCLS